jgi:hypothetical protein
VSPNNGSKPGNWIVRHRGIHKENIEVRTTSLASPQYKEMPTGVQGFRDRLRRFAAGGLPDL